MTISGVILAGGRGSRLGGADKARVRIGGTTLLSRALEAASDAGCASIVVAGPESDAETAPGIVWLREDPPFTGPAAALVAALTGREYEADWTLVLACDLVRPDLAVRQLLRDLPLLPNDTDGLCLADASGRPQWLTGIYRTRALRDAASALPDAGRNAAVRELMHDLAIAAVRAAPEAIADIDTWDDLREWKGTV